jgi:penicillin-binding protein A
MKEINKNIKFIFKIYFLLFFILIFNLLHFSIVRSESIITNPYNPRLRHDNEAVKRGYILDTNHVVLAHSYLENDAYIRNYTYSSAFSHVVGHKDFGKTGVEARYNFELQRLHNEFFQRVRSIIFGNELVGNSVVLTIDSYLQNMIYNELDGKRGAVVVIEPSTGKILSMVSNPSYNPNYVAKNWDWLREDTESPLLNRASQGLYPPGSVFKIVTALAGINNLEYAQYHTYICTGKIEVNGASVRNFNNVAHGEINMKQAFALSCNTYFASIGMYMGADKLKETANQLYFNNSLELPFNSTQSSFVLNQASPESEIITTSIGQGETLVTPFHMAMITSAVANGGIMMKPYIFEYAITYNNLERRRTIPTDIGRVMSLEESNIIKEMMVYTVNYGTATNASVSGIQVAGKTGTAENVNESHGWFVAFAPAENPEIAISIILENSHSPAQAVILARKIIEHTLIS